MTMKLFTGARFPGGKSKGGSLPPSNIIMLEHNTTQSYQYFGNSVAGYNEWLAVGTKGGKIEMFRKEGSEWISYEILDTSPKSGTNYITSMKFINNKLVIIHESFEIIDTYIWDGSTWGNPIPIQPGNFDIHCIETFSHSGNDYLYAGGYSSPSVYKYQWNGSNWAQVDNISLSWGNGATSICYSDEWLVISFSYTSPDFEGAIECFRNSSGMHTTSDMIWTFYGPGRNAKIGTSLYISKSKVAYGTNTGGKVYYLDAVTGVKDSNDLSFPNSSNSKLGHRIIGNGTDMYVSGYYHSLREQYMGSVFKLEDMTPGGLVDIENGFVPDSSYIPDGDQAEFGYDMAFVDGGIAISAPKADGDKSVYDGKVFIYKD